MSRTSRRRFLKSAGIAAAGLGALAGEADAAGNEVITAVTFIRGIEGMEKALEAHLHSLAGPTRAEPGCVAYDLYKSAEKPSDFMRLEIWTSPSALETHKSTPHIRESFAKRKREGWTTEITVWKRLHE